MRTRSGTAWMPRRPSSCIDRAGKVALYHPGQMTREELEPQIAKIVAAAPKP